MNKYDKAVDYVSNKAKEIAVAGAITVTSALGLTGCQTAQSLEDKTASPENRAYSSMSTEDQLKYLNARRQQRMKNGGLTQDEISDVLTDKKRGEAIKEAYTGSDELSKAFANGAQKVIDDNESDIQTLANDPRAKVRVVVYTKDDANASVRIWGIYKGEHFQPLKGTAAEISKNTDVSLYDLLDKAQAGPQWGEVSGAYLGEDGDKARMRQYLVFVPKTKESHDAVLSHIDKELKSDNKERLTVNSLKQRNVIHYALVLEIDPIVEKEEPKEQTPREILEEKARDKKAVEELPPKPQPRPKAPKKGKDDFGVDED
jgi:hypothetical protein